MENLARYIIRASFSQERMTYHRETGQVEYKSKDGAQTKVFDALEWLAAMCSHVPNKGEQMVRYYGYYSNVARGKRKKADADDKILCILEPQLTGKTSRVFPAYDEQPGPRADDYIRDPAYPAEAYF